MACVLHVYVIHGKGVQLHCYVGKGMPYIKCMKPWGIRARYQVTMFCFLSNCCSIPLFGNEVVHATNLAS